MPHRSTGQSDQGFILHTADPDDANPRSRCMRLIKNIPSAYLDKHVACCLAAKQEVLLGSSGRALPSEKWREDVQSGTRAFS